MTTRAPARTRRRALLLGAGTAVVAVAVVGFAVIRRGAEPAVAGVAASAGGPVTPEPSTPPNPTPPTTVVLPSQSPAHAVGVTSLTLVDDTRSTGARGGRPETSSRTVGVTVRYPVAGVAGPDEQDDAVPVGPAPLVVFAHGFDTSQATYAALLHDLAAAGFVVAAPEFPLSTSAAEGPPVEGDEGEQARDLSLVIDRLTDGETAPALTAALRPGPVGVVGHSDGAITALLAAYSPAYADDRIGAVVDVSGAFDDYGGTWFSTQDPPLLSLHGAADELNPLANDEQLVNADPGAADLVVVGGASHLGAVTGPAEPAVARLVADDLAWRLEEAPDGRAVVAVDEGMAPLRLVVGHGD
jgi:predicted dienelactone hydrolase